MNLRALLVVSLLLLLPIASAFAEDAPAPADAQELQKKFAETMSNGRMSGFYTIEGQAGPPQQDQYTLGKVEKADGDKWRIVARIEYGKKVISVPLELPVLWAGDTAVITLDHFTIPTLGTFDARVMIHGDNYSGVWSAGPDHKGFLWGRITHVPPGSEEKLKENTSGTAAEKNK